MLWPFGRASQILTLNRDARDVVADATERFRAEQMRQLCDTIRERLAYAANQLENPQIGLDNVLVELRNLHRDARRRGLDVRLSALTLTIIRLRAGQFGAECTDALEAIEALLGRWPDIPDAPDPARPCTGARPQCPGGRTLEA